MNGNNGEGKMSKKKYNELELKLAEEAYNESMDMITAIIIITFVCVPFYILSKIIK